jgi:hypothetical protein
MSSMKLTLPLPAGSYPFLTRYPELALHHWAQEYGSLYSLWIGNQLFIVISDAHVAKDIMVMQGKIFSSRKESFIKGQTVFVSRGVVSTPYGDKWCAFALPLALFENEIPGGWLDRQRSWY